MFSFNSRRPVSKAQVIKNLLEEGQLQEARRAGEEALTAGDVDDEVIEVLVEVYLKLEAECLESGVTSLLPRITERIVELLPQLTARRGELGERHNELVRKSLPGYKELSRLEKLSLSTGSERLAFEEAKAFLAASNPDPRLLPVYGTILSRYLRVAATEDDSTVARRLLAEYLSLPLQHPSRLHSLIMRQAVRLARKFPDFRFGRFVRMWDPAMMRPEDIHDPEGKSSLAVAVFEILLESDDVDILPALLERIPGNDGDRMDVLRSAFARLVDRNFKEGNTARGCELLSLYARHASMHVPCRQHSLMLELALRMMKGDQEWRFPEFFINWGCDNFTTADFETVQSRTGDVKMSLVNRSLRRCCNIVKEDIVRYSYLLNSLLASVDTIIRNSPSPADELLRRRRAGVIAMLDRPDLALTEYSLMAREKGRSATFWTEYADLVTDHRLKASLFALALSRGELTPEDAARMKLFLARELHFAGFDNESAGMLDDYSDYCTSVAAEPLPVYGAVRNVIPEGTAPRYDNELLYHSLAADALDFIYGNLALRKFSILMVDGDNLTISDTVQELTVSSRDWPMLSRLVPGDNLEIKCEGENVVMVRPAGGEPYGALKTRMAVCIEPGRVVCAGSSHDIPCRGTTVPGRCYEVRIYRREGFGWHAVAPREVHVVDARREFGKLTAAFYDVKPCGSSYSTGPAGVHGTVPESLAERFQIGDVADLYYYETEARGRVVFSVTEALKPEDCRAVRELSAPLRVSEDGKHRAGDVIVHGELYDDSLRDTYVKVHAVYHPEEGGHWVAFRIVPYVS